LSRLDIKNWTPTPLELRRSIVEQVLAACGQSDAAIVLDQVDVPETGVVGIECLEMLRKCVSDSPARPIVGDSRRGLLGWPPIIFKMNAAELSKLAGLPATGDLESIGRLAAELAGRNQQPVFVSISERGIVGATPRGPILHVPARPVAGPIDIVGAGDAVTANLTAALAALATPLEAMELSMAAASVVIHQLGTTGTASVEQVRQGIEFVG
jgi:fructose-1-phosphate kinase PfkB-like protein